MNYTPASLANHCLAFTHQYLSSPAALSQPSSRPLSGAFVVSPAQISTKAATKDATKVRSHLFSWPPRWPEPPSTNAKGCARVDPIPPRHATPVGLHWGWNLDRQRHSGFSRAGWSLEAAAAGLLPRFHA